MDFESHSPEAFIQCKELAWKLLKSIPKLSPKAVNWTKIQQCKQRSDESIWTIMGDWGRKKKKNKHNLLSNILV